MYRVVWEVVDEHKLDRCDAIAREGAPVVDPASLIDRGELTELSKSSADARVDVSEILDELGGFRHAFFVDQRAAIAAARALSQQAGIRNVGLHSRPTRPFARQHRPPNPRKQAPERDTATSGPTPDFQSKQEYLQPAPVGIDAEYAWTKHNADGYGTKLIDIEHGWNFDHEDLQHNELGVVYPKQAPRPDDHGTAVLGILGGDSNPIGVVGIAPGAAIGAASGDDDCDRTWNPESTIIHLLVSADPGDVFLLEMHMPGPHAQPTEDNETAGYVPLEYCEATYRAVRLATRNGMHVVAAAGNGGISLDHASLGGRFDPRRRDSGAIMVGAGAAGISPKPRTRLDFSNYGSRVDVHGWGEWVTTTGGRSKPYYYDLQDHPDPNRCYTHSFKGTSSAAPIVAGAVLLIESACKAAQVQPPTPLEMRRLLAETGTPQPATDPGRIGPLPDLRAAFGRLGLP